MKYNLDRPVRFSRDSEHKSLYTWSLHEVAPSGEKLGRDLIPWEWTVRFVASGLRLHSDLRLERVFRDDRSVALERHSTAALLATLWFDADYSAESPYRGTTLSMLGTEREISDISLRIVPLKDETESEVCTLWGSPSYTTDIDFRDETIPDMLEIHLAVTPARFRELAEVTSCPTSVGLSMTLSRVSGLYSDWSPAVGTDSIKVLTDREAHTVEEEPIGELTLPRLGDVGEVTLSLVQHAQVNAPKPSSEPDDEPLDAQVTPSTAAATSTEVETLQRLLRELAITRHTVASLKTPIWLAAVLLGLLLVFR